MRWRCSTQPFLQMQSRFESFYSELNFQLKVRKLSANAFINLNVECESQILAKSFKTRREEETALNEHYSQVLFPF